MPTARLSPEEAAAAHPFREEEAAAHQVAMCVPHFPIDNNKPRNIASMSIFGLQKFDWLGII